MIGDILIYECTGIFVRFDSRKTQKYDVVYPCIIHLQGFSVASRCVAILWDSLWDRPETLGWFKHVLKDIYISEVLVIFMIVCSCDT